MCIPDHVVDVTFQLIVKSWQTCRWNSNVRGLSEQWPRWMCQLSALTFITSVMSGSASVFLNEQVSSYRSVSPSSVSSPPQAPTDTICPSLLQIAAPQPMQPITFGTGILAGQTFHGLAVSSQLPNVEPGTGLDAVDATAGLSDSSPINSRPQDVTPIADAAIQDAMKRGSLSLPLPPLRSKAVISHASTPRRVEKGKRTPQACERCRIRKTKVRTWTFCSHHRASGCT